MGGIIEGKGSLTYLGYWWHAAVVASALMIASPRLASLAAVSGAPFTPHRYICTGCSTGSVLTKASHGRGALFCLSY